MDWDPDTYQTYRRERVLALHDLIGRVPVRYPRKIVDLGCGTGTSTAWLAERYPQATLIAVDSSRRMLAQAKTRGINATWRHAPLADFEVPAGVEMIFANGCLHQVADHPRLFEGYAQALTGGGVLAVQMPFNNGDESHALAQAIARSGPWSAELKDVDLVASPVLELGAYSDLLSARAQELWVWESVYLHRLSGPAPVLEWMRPYLRSSVLNRLDAGRAAAFLEALAEAYARAFPPGADGATLFPVRRRFVVAEFS